MDLQGIVNSLNEKGVSVHFHKENLIFTGSNDNPMNKLMLQMMGAFAEFERSLIRERQKEGTAKAKKMGKQIGRKRVLDKDQIEEFKVKIAGGEAKSTLAKE
jgi:DNA invertase Pin-like site-specific DNA recombinase